MDVGRAIYLRGVRAVILVDELAAHNIPGSKTSQSGTRMCRKFWRRKIDGALHAEIFNTMEKPGPDRAGRLPESPFAKQFPDWVPLMGETKNRDGGPDARSVAKPHGTWRCFTAPAKVETRPWRIFFFSPRKFDRTARTGLCDKWPSMWIAAWNPT